MNTRILVVAGSHKASFVAISKRLVQSSQKEFNINKDSWAIAEVKSKGDFDIIW